MIYFLHINEAGTTILKAPVFSHENEKQSMNNLLSADCYTVIIGQTSSQSPYNTTFMYKIRLFPNDYLIYLPYHINIFAL